MDLETGSKGQGDMQMVSRNAARVLVASAIPGFTAP